jgi:thioredoxin
VKNHFSKKNCTFAFYLGKELMVKKFTFDLIYLLITIYIFTMKKLTVFTILLLLFTACGNRHSKKADNENQHAKTMATIHLSENDFVKKVANIYTQNKWKYLGDKPCIIDFYADWCGPCKIIAPFLEELAAEYSGKIYIYKINVDEARELSEMFNIQSIPTLLFIPMNEDPQVTQGVLPKNELKKLIDEILLQK